MAGKLQLLSAAIRLQFLSSFTAARLSSGTERTARALSKVSTDRLNLMGGGTRPSNAFMTLFSNFTIKK